MREQFENDLINALAAYIPPDKVQDARMEITIVTSKYDISLAETAVAIWQGDKNEIIMKRYIASKLAKGLSKRTIDYYRQTLKWFFQAVEKNYDDVTADDIRVYLAIRIQKDGISKTSANNERRNLSAFYTWLQKEEILLKNPMNKVEAIKEQKRKKKAYSLLDLEKIRLGCRTKREKAMVEVLASTWCRVSEVMGMKITDIHDGQIEVLGKGDKYRTVYLNARAVLSVEEYLKERADKSPYLFPGSKYSVRDAEYREILKKSKLSAEEWYRAPDLVSDKAIPDPSILENTIRKIGKRAGVEKAHPHRFRRTGATMALRQGMPITTVSKILGHESIETTQIYLDISDEELEQAHRKYVV